MDEPRFAPLDLNEFAEICHNAHIAFCLDKFPSHERALEHFYIEHLNQRAAVEAAQPEAVDNVCDSLIQAWTLGQYYRGHNDRDDQLGAFKAQETHTKFVALLDKTRALLASAPTIQPTQPVQEAACPVCKGAQGWAPGHPCMACYGSGIDPDVTPAQAGDAGEPSDGERDVFARRWEMLAYMHSRGVPVAVMEHYIGRPDRLDYTAELHRERDAAIRATKGGKL